MPAAKPLTRQQILKAQERSKSNRAAARLLLVDYHTYRKYAKMYRVDENDLNSPTLFEKHLNPKGKGIPKFLPNKRKEPTLDNILKGGDDWVHFSPEKIKTRLIIEGKLLEQCDICGFCEHRDIDYKTPLLMAFKDKNKANYNLQNLQLLCYNCYFLYYGNVFTDDQIKNMQDTQKLKDADKLMDLELDADQLANLRALGIDI